MKKKIVSPLIVIISLFLVVSCKTGLDDEKIISPEISYASGVTELENGNYSKAAGHFEKIFLQHPGNKITPQAELMQAYSFYLAGEYDDVVDVLEIFIKLHPRHQDIAYAYYLKALANYVQISDVFLDQSRTYYAKQDFEELINRFPGTKYALDASMKIDLVNDHLAGKEMLIGRYYLNKKNPIAAAKRFQNVLDEYDTTSHTEEALYRSIETNMVLGIKEEALKYFAVLQYNYPRGNWLKRANKLLKEEQEDENK